MSRSLSGIGNNIYMLAAGSTTGGTGIKITGTTNSTSNTINLDITGLTTKTNINTTDYFLVEQSDEVLKKIKFSELTGIGNNDLVKVDSSFATDNDYVKFTTVGVEGRSYTEVKTDLSLNLVENTAISTFDGTGNNIVKLGTVSQGTWNATAITNAYIDTGIADNKIVEIDSSSVASTEYACFTSNGLESKNATEMRTYLNISNVENTAISTFDGTGNNITKLGTIATGTWNATTIAMTKGGTGFTGIGKGEIFYGDASLAIAKLAVGTNGHYLTLSSGIPAWTDLISTTIRTSSSQPTIAIPTKTSGHTLACLDDTETNTSFGTNTSSGVALGNTNTSSTSVRGGQITIDCSDTSAGSRVSVFNLTARSWDGGSEQNYQKLIEVVNSNPQADANDPQLKLKLNDTNGSDGQVITCDSNGFCKWAFPSTATQWTLSSSTLSPSAGTSTNVNIGAISGTPAGSRFVVNGDSTFQGYIATGAILNTQNTGVYLTKNVDFSITNAHTWHIYQGGGGDCHWDWGTALGSLNPQGYVSMNEGAYDKMNFTGQHRCITENQSIIDNIDNYIGLVVISTGKYNSIIHDNKQDDPSTDIINVNDAQPIVELSNKVRDKRVYGIISNVETKDTQREYGAGVFMSVVNKKIEKQRLFINSVGEGGIKVCNENGNISNGDLLTTSSKEGLAMKQNDGIMKNYTIGKATQDYNFTGDTDYKLIGCVYYCG